MLVMRTALAVTVLLLSACTPRPGLWEWRHPDPSYAEKYRARDIAECEEHAREAEMDGRNHLLKPARPYGGWGDFPFEWCMQERGWRLEFVER